MSRWKPQEDRAIARMAERFTAKQIAQVLGRTPAAVHQRACIKRVKLQKAGDRDYRTKYPDTTVERARQLHDAGYGPRAIAQLLGVPEGSVRSFVYYRGRSSASLTLISQGGAK